jgi:hypothetical protein
MTRIRRSISISILADSRITGTALALALVALALLGAVTAGPATAQNDQPTVRVVGDTAPADGTTTVRIVLTEAPDGLSGYYLDLTVDGPARIESASYSDGFGLTSDPVVGDNGHAVTLEAADVGGQVEPGATDVTLATVELAGTASGEAELTVRPRQFDNDDGTGFEPAVRPGTVTVTGDDTANPSGDSGTATDTTAPNADSGATAAANENTETGAEPTTGDGPLSPALVLVALTVVAALAARHHRP